MVRDMTERSEVTALVTERSEGVSWLSPWKGHDGAERSEVTGMTERSEGISWLSPWKGHDGAERSEVTA
jgi:hypothetical protein